MTSYDAVIIGSGPNGLSAAIRLAEEGLSVLVLEGQETIGGGTRTAELTEPGFLHDICSAIHPLALASPFLRTLPLADYGLEWVQPDAPLAHALRPEEAVVLPRELGEVSQALGPDGAAYRRLMEPYVRRWQDLMDDFLGPLPIPPRHPFLMAGFGLTAIRSASGLARGTFRGPRARALFAGLAAHSMMPLEWPAMGGFGMMLGILAHAVGWPMARGGSQRITEALGAHLESLGGRIETGVWVHSLDELPAARAVLFNTTPRGLLSIAGDRLAPGYARQLERYQYGPGVCKVDWALDEAVPWQAPELARTATVHIGGSFETIAASERAVWQGRVADEPYVLFVQQSGFDCSRAPQGRHTAWAYCHVPHGSERDYSDLIESQVERYAPGFKDTIRARRVYTAVEMAAYNPNYVGGDINGGVQNLRQFYTRPAVRWNPYRVPQGGRGQERPHLYIASSAVPPGGGVHGMGGFYAAEAVLKDLA